MMKNIQSLNVLLLCLFTLTGCGEHLQTPAFSDFKGQSPAKLYETGEKALSDGKFNKAVKYLTALNRFHLGNPYTESAYLKLIDCYAELDQFHDAIQVANIVIQSCPQVGHEVIRRKMAAFQHRVTGEGRWDCKELRCPILVNFERLSVSQIYQQANAALSEKRHNAAIGAFKALNKLYPDNAYAESVYIHLIQCCIGLNQSREAIKMGHSFMLDFPHSRQYSEIRRLVENLQKQLEQEKLDQWLQRFNGLENRLSAVQAEVDNFKVEFNRVNHRLDTMRTNLNTTSSQIAHLTSVQVLQEQQMENVQRRMNRPVPQEQSPVPNDTPPPPYTP